MATRLPNASQQAGADAVVDRADLGTGTATGKLRIYSGAQPADADSAPVGTLLLEADLANPAFGSANSSGTAAMSGGTRTGTGAAAGTGQSFRVINRDGATVFDGAVSMSGGGGDLILDNTNIAVGRCRTASPRTRPEPRTTRPPPRSGCLVAPSARSTECSTRSPLSKAASPKT